MVRPSNAEEFDSFSRYSMLEAQDSSMAEVSPSKLGRLRTKFDTEFLPSANKQLQNAAGQMVHGSSFHSSYSQLQTEDNREFARNQYSNSTFNRKEAYGYKNNENLINMVGV